MRPSPILCRRIKSRVSFTTKQVAKGFYRGTGTGSMGAHTATGHYIVDWRKVRHYVVPDLKDVKLTPFVSAENYIGQQLPVDPDGLRYKDDYDGWKYLSWFKNQNPAEHEWLVRRDAQLRPQEAQLDESFLSDAAAAPHQQQTSGTGEGKKAQG